LLLPKVDGDFLDDGCVLLLHVVGCFFLLHLGFLFKDLTRYIRAFIKTDLVDIIIDLLTHDHHSRVLLVEGGKTFSEEIVCFLLSSTLIQELCKVQKTLECYEVDIAVDIQ
jgi:hypothetical protein